METTTQQVDLFGAELPSLDELAGLEAHVNSCQRNRQAFAELVDANLSQKNQHACLATGIGLVILGRCHEALDRLEKAADCQAKYLYLARANTALRRFTPAIDNLDNYQKHGADPLAVALEKARVYRRSGQLDLCEKQLQACANFESVNAEYHYQLARLQEQRGQYDQATENYRRALDLAPDHPRALFHLAYRCDLAGDEEAAIDYYRQVLARSPVYVNALLNLAVLYEDAGQFDKAAACVEKVLKFHPNHHRARLFKKDIESSKTMYFDEEKQKRRDEQAQILQTPLSDFELSVRSRNCLRKMGIKTLGDLLKISEAELLSYKNFGETSLREIKTILESKGLKLGGALESQETDEDADDAEAQERKMLLAKPVEELGLSVRSRKCLAKLEVRTLEDLTNKTDAELLGCKNFGVTSLNEIKKALEKYGLSLRTLD